MGGLGRMRWILAWANTRRGLGIMFGLLAALNVAGAIRSHSWWGLITVGMIGLLYGRIYVTSVRAERQADSDAPPKPPSWGRRHPNLSVFGALLVLVVLIFVIPHWV